VPVYVVRVHDGKVQVGARRESCTSDK